MSKGLVIVYTGNGKGKTTAALGSALRAYGRGLKVALMYFLKDSNQGEINCIEKLDGFDYFVFGTGRFINFDDIKPEDLEPVKKGLDKLKEILENETYDMVVLDEVLITLYYGLIETSDLLEIMDSRKSTHLILTGRYAPSGIIECADIVSEIGKIKHHFDKGAPSIQGIEY
ncbi:MAG: cob(I)yrinic acid a,c-diamide adenosyltransferase [Caldisericia bacterium]|nr:cob(I)yrinic acid a,c-diamide adenosyltransferase [Caldisericia bacterium]